jgi:hypothetical protein
MYEQELTDIFKAMEPETEAPEMLRKSVESDIDTVVLGGKIIELFTIKMGESIIKLLGG